MTPENVPLVVYQHRHGDRYAGLMECLLRGEAPSPATVDQVRDLLLVKWVPDISDLGAVKSAMGAREKWLASVLDLPRDQDFNELGDKLIYPPRMERHPPLTFYQPSSGVGIKALAFDLDQESLYHSLEEPLSWVQAGELPDGTPLRSLIAIVPEREHAIFMRRSDVAAGVRRVFYPSEDGSIWWDPDPPGEWYD